MKISIAIPYLGEEEAEAAKQVVLSGWVTQGPVVSQFEAKFAEVCNAKYAVAVSNGTTALHLSLLMAGVTGGDEVLCPSMSFIATANSIQYCGAKPVFCEVEDDYNISPKDILKKITPKTKAILIVHQVGTPANLEEIAKIAKDNNLKIIEDAACAIGSKYNNEPIGSYSDTVCFSLHPRKIITTGEGGMITTNSESIYNKLKLLRQHGMSINDQVRHNSKSVIVESYDVLGYNYRMTDIQAAIGIEQLKKLDFIVSERRRQAAYYFDKLAMCKDLKLPLERPYQYNNYQSFSITITNDRLSVMDIMQKLLDVGISSRRGIMLAHKEEPYKHLGLSLPISEKLAKESFLIPIYPGLSDEELEYITTTLKKLLKS
ncbi:DegT/DnrJ/EryC1/StrS family aminotransferase [Flavobacteriales bacterium]|nr:DegT/DnrJ/EryC1/StrS family aminotransferase [Flavobacteriales bacterium]